MFALWSYQQRECHYADFEPDRVLVRAFRPELVAAACACGVEGARLEVDW